MPVSKATWATSTWLTWAPPSGHRAHSTARARWAFASEGRGNQYTPHRYLLPAVSDLGAEALGITA